MIAGQTEGITKAEADKIATTARQKRQKDAENALADNSQKLTSPDLTHLVPRK